MLWQNGGRERPLTSTEGALLKWKFYLLPLYTALQWVRGEEGWTHFDFKYNKLDELEDFCILVYLVGVFFFSNWRQLDEESAKNQRRKP